MSPHPASRFESMRAACEAKPHGVRARYVGGCRCMLCRAANSRYSSTRQAARDAGDRRELVSANEAVAYIRFLGGKGVGYKSVAAAAGLSPTTLQKILKGERTKIRRDAAKRILAVDQSAVADHALIDSRPTWKILDELISLGYTKRWLAQKLRAGHSIQFNRQRITAKSASKVERLYRLIEAGRISR